MSFAWPQVFWALLLPVALLAWEITHRRRTAARSRPKILRAEAGVRSLVFTASAAPTGGSRPRVWLCVGLALVITALARPQWGRLEEPVFDQSREILLAIDLSRSMLAEDIRPSRLDRAKLLIQSLLEKLQGERVGLVVFSGTAFLQSPLSADYEILREFLPALGPEFLPEGGSNYGALLNTSLQAFGATGSADRFLIILSDGEATDDEWKTKIEELKKKNIRVIGLGIGTANGAMIPDGSGGLVKDDRGAVVLSKLESGTLQQLSQDTGGLYRDASAWVDLAAMVNETIEAGRKGQFVEKNTVRLVERFQWPLAFGLWCLFVSFCYEFPVRPKPRQIALRATVDGDPKTEDGSRKEAVTTAVAVLCILSSVLCAPTSAHAAVKLATPPATAEAAKPDEAATLAKIVGRLAARENPTARDWAELGRETVTWGSHLQSQQQPVPEDPVWDALAAVELGAKLDKTAADWPKLKGDLLELLKKPDEDEKKDEKKPPQDQSDDQQQQKQDQNKSDQKQKDQKNQQNQQQENDNAEKNESGEESSQKKEEQKEKQPGESAFGDMTKKDEPPPPPQSTQKVGGAPEKKDEQKEPLDPALALPMQKLEQLKNQDSPAQLFQLMEGEKKSTKKPGKDW